MKNKLIAVGLGSVLVACSGGSSGGGKSGGGSIPASPPSNPTQVNYTILEQDLSGQTPAACNPFGGSGTSGRTTGIYGSLTTLNVTRNAAGQITSPAVNTLVGLRADHYFGRAPQGEVSATPISELQLFFDKIDIPTRPFDRGFTTQDGRVLQVSATDASPLYEYFGLKFESELQLTATDSTGWYQLAILSDDGAMVYLKPSGTGDFALDIDNDGTHANRIRCGSPFYLEPGKKVPMKIEYYQGQRYYMAAQVLWRYVGQSNPATAPSDAECVYNNVPGDSNIYFDADHQAAPTQRYNDFLARGWSVVSTGNYALPAFITSNPCSDTWPIAGRSCYTETWNPTSSSLFVLAHANPDTSLLRVFVNNRRAASNEFQYLSGSNSVQILNGGVSAGSEVKIQYCQALTCGRDCGGGVLGE